MFRGVFRLYLLPSPSRKYHCCVLRGRFSRNFGCGWNLTLHQAVSPRQGTRRRAELLEDGPEFPAPEDGRPVVRQNAVRKPASLVYNIGISALREPAGTSEGDTPEFGGHDVVKPCTLIRKKWGAHYRRRQRSKAIDPTRSTGATRLASSME